jgi:biopolymer transport protein ExbB
MTLSASLRRLLVGLLCGWLALTLLGVTPFGRTNTVYAQEEGGEEQPPADAAPKPAEESMVQYMFNSLGLVFLVVLGTVSVSLIAIVVLLLMDLRMSAAVPPDFVADFSELVNKRQFKAAYDLSRNDSSFLGRVMTTGMGRLQYGIEDARMAAFQMVDTIRASKAQLIAYLATIGTLGPLLGLVGTVWGMIGAFRTLSTSNKIDATEISGHIGHALVVTLFGVALSVPAIFAHTFFNNRLTRLSMDTGNVADDLLTQMYHNSKKPAGAEVPQPVSGENRIPAAGGAAIKPK